MFAREMSSTNKFPKVIKTPKIFQHQIHQNRKIYQFGESINLAIHCRKAIHNFKLILPFNENENDGNKKKLNTRDVQTNNVLRDCGNQTDYNSHMCERMSGDNPNARKKKKTKLYVHTHSECHRPNSIADFV